MIALDTNILARYLLADDAVQAESAARLLESQQAFFIPVTVGLELAWVLRSEGVRKPDIIEAIQHLRGLPDVTWQDNDAWTRALALAGAGLDIADAIHVSLSATCTSMLTFDARFAAWAQREHTQPALALVGHA